MMNSIYKLFMVPTAILVVRLILIKWIWCWETAEGHVIGYDIKSRKYPSKFPEMQDNYIAYWLKAKYSYQVNDKVYISKRVSLDIMDRIYTVEEINSDNLLLCLRSGSVTVYYFKYFPRLSVITMPFQKGKDHILIIFALMLMMTIITIIVKIAYGPNI